MNKAVKYTINGVLICGIGNAILNALEQIFNEEENKPFKWSETFSAFGKGALIGGAGGFALGAIKDNEMSETLVVVGGTAGFLNEALNNYSDENSSLSQKANKVQKKLYNEFREYLSQYPSVSGSIVKGTAIQSSDIDIQLKFNKKADTLQNIRSKVEDYLNEKFYDKNLVKVRSQNHSIGLIFDLQGEEKRIDIVPMREIENGKGDTYLFSTNNNSIRKTNTQKQYNKLQFTERQTQIIRLLKGWKLDNNLNIPSVLIEHIVKKVFEESKVPSGLDKGLLFVIEYIGNNITRIRIIDPANTNNIISDCLNQSEKEWLQNFCFRMLEEINKDKRNILDYFKID